MPFFKDASEREWKVNFDGVLLKQLRDDEQLNLSDISGASYIIIQNDPSALVRALGVICADEIKAAGLTIKQFAARITGEVIDRAWEACWEAARLFFPARLWSSLQSNFTTQLRVLESWQSLQPLMATLNKPEIPDGMRQAAMTELAKIIHTVSVSGLAKLAANPSATGLAELQSKPATDLPATSASKRKGKRSATSG